MVKSRALLELAGIVLVLFAFPSSAQDFTYFNYNEQNILPSSEVYHIFQDRSGFIWFATDNGVVRFDGADFTTYNKTNGLADPVVFGVHEGQNGDLYFRTFSGSVSVFSKGEMKPYPYNHLIKPLVNNSLISAIVVDNSGTLHFATSATFGKIVSIDASGKVQTQHYPTPSLFVEQKGNQVLIGRGGILGSINDVIIDGKEYRIPRHDSTENSGVLAHSYWKGKLYISKDRFLYSYDGRSVRLVKQFNKSIVSVSRDRSDHLWIGQLNGGVERFSDTTFQSGYSVRMLEKQSVTTVLEDNEGGLWFSTLERGVFYAPNLEIQNYSYPPFSRISAVAASSELAFIGSFSGKLCAIEVATRNVAWSFDLQYPVMSAYYDTLKSELWVSTNSNVKVFSTGGKLLREMAGVKSVKKFFRYPTNEIGAANANGIYKVDKLGYLKAEKNLDFWLRNILVTDNEIYLAGVTGLYKADLGCSVVEPIKELENLKVSGMELLPSKDVVIASIGNGIRVISKDGRIQVPNQSDFLFENVYQVWIDSCAWIASEKGLFKVATSALANNGVKQYDFIDKGTGLLNNKVNFIWRFKNETWCFLSDGFSILRNDKMKFANQKPKNYIKNIYINHSKVKDNLAYDLLNTENNVGISLGFISFNNRNIILRHRILESNQQWNYSKVEPIDYFSLAPGSHKFDVQFSPNYTTWRHVDFPYTFKIRPAWWESVYFKIMVVLLSSFSFYFLFRVRYKRKLLRLEMQNKLRSEKERIARDLHDNIGSKLVSLSLGLDSMKKNNSSSNAMSEMLIENVNSIVTELRDTIWVIQKDDITLTEFIDKLDNLVWRLRQQHVNPEFQFSVDKIDGFENNKFNPLVAINLFRVIQEIITNSQKHSKADNIQLRVQLDRLSSSLKIIVEDNGAGFDVEKVMQNGHYGLANIKLRSAEIGAKINIQSDPGNGTRVQVDVNLPVNHNGY